MNNSGFIVTTLCAALLLNACGKQQQQEEEPSATEPAASLSAPAPQAEPAPSPVPAAQPVPEPVAKAPEETAAAPATEQAAAPKVLPAQEEKKTPAPPAGQKPAAEQMAAASEKKTGDGADALALAQKSGCLACHNVDKKVVGPAWKDVAARYKGDAGAKDKLIAKVKTGGKGNWTEVTGGMSMPPYSPRIADADIEKLVTFVLSLK